MQASDCDQTRALTHFFLIFFFELLFSSVEADEGDYMFCFDNTFSAVSEKIIFFELILDNMEADEEPDEWKEYVHGTDSLDMKLEDIMVRLQLQLLKAFLSECVRFSSIKRQERDM